MLKIIVFLTIAIISFANPHRLNSNAHDSVSLKHFHIFNILGHGAFGDVYLAKKLGGSDDGKLYALKSQNISLILEREEYLQSINRSQPVDMLNNEREMLEAVRGLSCATELHYAFSIGNFLFLVMDFGSGGNLETNIDANPPDAAAQKLIVAEMVTALEKLHNVGIHHRDLYEGNLVIDANGHVILTDFGQAKWLSDKSAKNSDWQQLANVCHMVFWNRGQNETSLIKLLNNMTDPRTQLPELKNHPYFHGIDWEQVADRKCDAPFEPIEILLDQNDHLDLFELMEIDVNYKLDAITAKRIHNYTFVAPEHQTHHEPTLKLSKGYMQSINQIKKFLLG